MDLIKLLQLHQDSADPLYLTLECRLGNPPELLGLSKYGVISDLTINEDKPKQSHFYINYMTPSGGDGVRFKASPHEVKMLVDNEGAILYISQDNDNKGK